MNQLFLNGSATTLFFTLNIQDQRVLNQIELMVIDSTNIFNLNEAHSCGVDLFQDTIVISGDEDYVEITFNAIIPII